MAVTRADSAVRVVACEDLVTGLAGDAELSAQRRHLLSIQQPGNEPQSFVLTSAVSFYRSSLRSQAPTPPSQGGRRYYHKLMSGQEAEPPTAPQSRGHGFDRAADHPLYVRIRQKQIVVDETPARIRRIDHAHAKPLDGGLFGGAYPCHPAGQPR